MQIFILFFKGFIIGIGKIIPGVSGSVLAISMGVYDVALEKIASIRHEFKEGIRYLLPLALGAISAIIIFSEVILYFLTIYKIITMCFFLGLLLGTIPGVIKNVGQIKKKEIFWLVLIIIVCHFVLQSFHLPEFKVSNVFSYLIVYLLGGFDALSTVIPGLSGTAIFLMLGAYTYVLNLLASPLNSLIEAIFFFLGFGFNFFLISKIITRAFKKHYHQTWVVITAFLFLSLFELFFQIPLVFNFKTIFFSIFFFLLGLIIVFLLPE